MNWNDFTLKNTGSTQSSYNITGYSSPKISNISVQDHTLLGAVINECFAPTVSGGNYSNNYQGTGAIGYGIQINGCRGGGVSAAHFSGNRRGIDFSGEFPSMYGVVAGCTADGNGGETGSAFGTHGGAAYCSFIGNNLGRNQYGFQIRGLGCSVINNTCDDAAISFVQYTDGQEITVKGNKIRRTQSLIQIFDEVMNKRTDSEINTMNFETITDNDVADILLPAIALDITSTQSDLYGYIVSGNNIMMRAGSSARYAIAGLSETDSLAGFTINQGCSWYGNNVKGRSNFSGVIADTFLMTTDTQANVCVHNVDANSLGAITASAAAGPGSVSAGQIQNGNISISRGRAWGTIHYNFTVIGGGVAGINLSIPWIAEEYPAGVAGRRNPLAVQAGSSGGHNLSKVSASGVVSVGGDFTSTAAVWADGTYDLFLSFDFSDDFGADKRFQV